jgi:hypothetical protein
MFQKPEGYIYCFSNSSMPGILKVGMTERTPEVTLNEANIHDTWRPPTPYKIEFAKKVTNPSAKEKILHDLLEKYTERIDICREFFRSSPGEVRKFFRLMDGEMWLDTRKEKEEEDTSSELIRTKTFEITLENIENYTQSQIQDENVKYGLARCQNETKEKSVKKLREHLESLKGLEDMLNSTLLTARR